MMGGRCGERGRGREGGRKEGGEGESGLHLGGGEGEGAGGVPIKLVLSHA